MKNHVMPKRRELGYLGESNVADWCKNFFDSTVLLALFITSVNQVTEAGGHQAFRRY